MNQFLYLNYIQFYIKQIWAAVFKDDSDEENECNN